MTTNNPDVLTILDEQFDESDRVTLSHARALRALKDAENGLPYRELASELNLSGRQTKRVIRELEDNGLVRRDAAPKGVHEPHRFRFKE